MPRCIRIYPKYIPRNCNTMGYSVPHGVTGAKARGLSHLGTHLYYKVAPAAPMSRSAPATTGVPGDGGDQGGGLGGPIPG